MADPASYRPAPADIPPSPGVYRFLDKNGRVIYVGKAVNLRNRLANYFQPLESLHPRTRKMVTTGAAVKWVTVGNELEALSLEYSWIKEFAPRFNVMYRDDKSYPYLALNMGEEYPRIHITRERRRANSRYFGPYTQVWAIRETMDLLRKVFPLRSCTKGVFNRSQALGRPCLEGYIDKCSAPCVGRISSEDYQQLAAQVSAFLDGKTEPFTSRLRQEMEEAASRLDFEQAAKLRDQLRALEKVREKNTVVLDESVDADVYAFAKDDLEMIVQVFYVRAGRIRGERGWVVDTPEDKDLPEMLESFLEQTYGEYRQLNQAVAPAKSVDDVEHTPTQAIPAEILMPLMPARASTLSDWLGDIRGKKVEIRVPQRGPKRSLMETVEKNAAQALRLHKTKRVGDLTQRSEALRQLQEYLELADAPLRIEGYDISHTQGTHQVGSMVVFEDGVPLKRAYRSFNIQSTPSDSADDTKAMNEVLTRRFARLREEEAEAQKQLVSTETSGERHLRRFSYPPDLIVVDGGAPQVNAAQKALEAVGANVSVIGLAKRLEEVWLPGAEFPVILPRTSPALYLLQYLRDESHRFAITAHRKKRGKTMHKSVLDAVPGLGPVRQKALLKHFGSLKRLRGAEVSEIAEVEGIGEVMAKQIFDSLADSR
ncbi:excinuclease ABC subunit UvrC [Varibaculum cambriense]|uniref:excinuclease ABC subunit UvrC n=1 Tax=Varibaculum cambriense TaxID=184870 RepID=UPI00242CAEAD|nr:excinuclease ABC subunit UvrC [Varibaculum cambriense]